MSQFRVTWHSSFIFWNFKMFSKNKNPHKSSIFCPLFSKILNLNAVVTTYYYLLVRYKFITVWIRLVDRNPQISEPSVTTWLTVSWIPATALKKRKGPIYPPQIYSIYSCVTLPRVKAAAGRVFFWFCFIKNFIKWWCPLLIAWLSFCG